MWAGGRRLRRTHDRRGGQPSRSRRPGKSSEVSFSCYGFTMATKKHKPPATPVASVEEAHRRYQFMDDIIRGSQGVGLDELESALGMYMIRFPLRLEGPVPDPHQAHDQGSTRRSLAAKVKERGFPEPLGPDADRTNAYKVIMARLQLLEGRVRRRRSRAGRNRQKDRGVARGESKSPCQSSLKLR